MQQVALIIKQKQINVVESIGNQNNQIRPCRLCLQFNSMRFSTSTPTTQRIQLFDSKFPAILHYQIVIDHSPCLPHFLLLNAESKSSSRTDEIRHYDCYVKFVNNTSGRARLWDTALKFLCPGLSITSPDHLAIWDNFSTFRTDCAIMTTYIRADHARVVGSRVDAVTLLDQMVRVARFSNGFFTRMAWNKAGTKNQGA